MDTIRFERMPKRPRPTEATPSTATPVLDTSLNVTIDTDFYLQAEQSVPSPESSSYSSLAQSYDSTINLFGKFKQEILSLPFRPTLTYWKYRSIFQYLWVNAIALTLRAGRHMVCNGFSRWIVMSRARRFLLLLLVLCLPLQSTLALSGKICDSMPASTAQTTMPMMSGYHDHAAMLAAQHTHDHGKSTANHPMGSCEHCAHCPACSLSTGVSTLTVQSIFPPATPETVRSDDALISLVLDTPQRPPQTA